VDDGSERPACQQVSPRPILAIGNAAINIQGQAGPNGPRVGHHLWQRGDPLSVASSGLRRNRVVLVDEPAEHVVPTDRSRYRLLGGGSARRDAEVGAAGGTLLVVVENVLAKDCFKVAAPEHQGPVQALSAYGPHKTLRMSIGAR